MSGAKAEINAVLGWLAIVWVVSAVYLGSRAWEGWIPHDEGLIGHSAERVLHWELPHRDFDEVYTGGLTYLHALAFKLLGVRLSSLRWPLLVFTLAWIPAVYWLALRAVRPGVAALITVACVAWSVPNYFAGLPSWYNLFLATFGAVCLLKFLDSVALSGAGRTRWLVAAGVCGGASMLVKVVGAYYLAAALLFVVYYEQVRALTADKPLLAKAGGGAEVGECRPYGFWAFKAAALGLFCLVLLRLVRERLTAFDTLLFIVPGVAIAVFLAWEEFTHGRGRSGRRFAALLRLVLPLVVGAVIPVLLFMAPYGFDDWRKVYEGVFVAPGRRFENAGYELPPIWTALWAVPYAVLLALGMIRSIPMAWVVAGGLALLLAVVLSEGKDIAVYQAVWFSTRPIVPMATIIGCAMLRRRFGGEGTRARGDTAASEKLIKSEEVLLLVAMAAMVSLVQYPYSAGIYFCYAAPLVILAIVYLVRRQPFAARPIHLCAAVFYTLFAVLWVHTGYIAFIGVEHKSLAEDAFMGERARLWMSRNGRAKYQALVSEIHMHAQPGSYIYAAPDCPDMYFLSGMKNPTRTIYDFLDAPSPDRVGRIMDSLEKHEVRVVVINMQPEFSAPISPEFQALLDMRYPQKRSMGVMQIQWRDQP